MYDFLVNSGGDGNNYNKKLNPQILQKKRRNKKRWTFQGLVENSLQDSVGVYVCSASKHINVHMLGN